MTKSPDGKKYYYILDQNQAKGELKFILCKHN